MEREASPPSTELICGFSREYLEDYGINTSEGMTHGKMDKVHFDLSSEALNSGVGINEISNDSPIIRSGRLRNLSQADCHNVSFKVFDQLFKAKKLAVSHEEARKLVQAINADDSTMTNNEDRALDQEIEAAIERCFDGEKPWLSPYASERAKRILKIVLNPEERFSSALFTTCREVFNKMTDPNGYQIDDGTSDMEAIKGREKYRRATTGLMRSVTPDGRTRIGKKLLAAQSANKESRDGKENSAEESEERNVTRNLNGEFKRCLLRYPSAPPSSKRESPQQKQEESVQRAQECSRTQQEQPYSEDNDGRRHFQSEPQERKEQQQQLAEQRRAEEQERQRQRQLAEQRRAEEQERQRQRQLAEQRRAEEQERQRQRQLAEQRRAEEQERQRQRQLAHPLDMRYLRNRGHLNVRGIHYRLDGGLDMRYKENRALLFQNGIHYRVDGLPDRRYRENRILV